MNHLRWATAYALGALGVYLAVDISGWVLMEAGVGRIISPTFALLVYLVTFVLVAVAVAVRADRHPVLTSAAVSGTALFASWAFKVPLTLLLPGLIQRDHDGWIGSVLVEGGWVGCLAAAIATVLALGTRLSIRLWRH
jgi:hypothetical protein